MGKIISVANQKGGVGKTTTAVNLSAALSYLNKKVLLVDFDSQSNATLYMGFQKNELDATIYNVLLDEVEIEEAILKSKLKNFDLLPSGIDLVGLDTYLYNNDNRDYILYSKLQKIKDNYDFILIDCPPSLGLNTINAFCASDSVIIPVQCHFLALDGLTQLFDTIRLINKKLKVNRRSIEIEGILITMLDNRTNAGYEVLSEVKTYFKEKVYSSTIPFTVHAQEAPRYGVPVTEYMPSSKSALMYNKLAKEVIKANVKKSKH